MDVGVKQPAGIFLETGSNHLLFVDAGEMAEWLDRLGLGDWVSLDVVQGAAGDILHAMLPIELAERIAPESNTLDLRSNMSGLTDDRAGDLEREIIVAMLLSPLGFSYPSFAELQSAVRIRLNIVQAAWKSALAFDTEHAERPDDYWTYAEDKGFTVRPGKSLIEALVSATQPERTGKRYSFSCYRATEYILLLAIAQELALSNLALLDELQRQWEARAVMSGEFHDVFLSEYGSLEHPLPQGYFVPGDRLWFRNPDELSANAEGYEGSWLFYLGGGLFTNFWRPEQPYTLTSKCIELYHWRDAVYQDEEGIWRINESVVDARVRESSQDAEKTSEILALMLRLRAPRGVYGEGGCLDATRECARRVRPGTAELSFPDAAASC
jgi:hypothetical protein